MKNINTYFDKIYLINLYWRDDRLADVIKQFEKHGITNYKVIDGYVGELFQPMRFKVNFSYGESSIGCLYSHLRCLHEAENLGYERILILEDDIKIHKDFSSLFDKIINQIEDDKWDLLYLGHMTINPNKEGVPKRKHEQFFEAEKNVFKANNSWGGHAYGVNKRFIKYYLKRFMEVPPMKWTELDRFLTNEAQNNIEYKSLKTYPQLFIQDSNHSDIVGNERPNFKNMINEGYSKIEDYYQ